MKRVNIYTFLLISLIIAATGIFLYQRSHEDTVAPLIERQGAIATTSEWLNAKAAIEGLQYKIRKNSNDTRSKLLLALAYTQEARVTGEHPYYYPAALKLVNDVLNREAIDQDIRYEATVAKAMIQLALHQFKNALQTGHIALKLNNRRAAVYGILCDANVELGNYGEAIKMADQMVAIRPDLMSYSRVSYLREIHGDLEGAIEAMGMAARAGQPGLEQTAWAKYNLGQLYEKTGNIQMAEFTYRQILEERPAYAFAIGGLAKIEAKKGNTEKAIALYTDAANMLPEFSFQEQLAHLYMQKGESKQAEKTLHELLEGFEEDQEAGHIMDLELAKVYLELDKNPRKALQYASKEYKVRPGNIDVCKTMAAIHYANKNYLAADKYIAKALRTNSKDATALCLRGLIDYKIGRKEIGTEYIRESFNLDPFQNGSISLEAKTLLRESLTSL